MLIQPCPMCDRSNALLLAECSKAAYVNYYRCQGCSHIWTASKHTGVINNHITPLHRKAVA
jgi:hypothetical protein